MTFVLAIGLPATASAVSTLSGEHFSGSSGGPSSIACNSSGPYSYTASGTATGPYPGTFTETGSGTVTPGTATLSASFTIHSGNFLITGSKNGGTSDLACQDPSGNTAVEVLGLSYQATINTSTGNYVDQGSSSAFVGAFVASFTLQEGFTSSLTEAVPAAPTTKDQCKKDGWKAFPQFKNQGQCVSSVASQSQT